MSNVPDGSAETSRLPNGPPTEEPQAWHFEYNPMHGREGTVYQFEFLYRRRSTMITSDFLSLLKIIEILQSVGCIPRSPSPSPDLQLALERAEDTIRLENQRAREANIENLRLRVCCYNITVNEFLTDILSAS